MINNFILTFIIAVGVFSPTAFSIDSEPLMAVKIKNQDETRVVDVLEEGGVFKLAVKASVVPELGDRFQERLMNGGTSDLAVNGSVTPVVFQIIVDPVRDKVIEECAIWFIDNGVKIQNFMGLNSPLTNGILVEILSSGIAFSFIPILKTVDINHYFSTGQGRFRIDIQAGGDYVMGYFTPETPFVLKAGTADFIKVTVRDNLNTVTEGEMLCDGILD